MAIPGRRGIFVSKLDLDLRKQKIERLKPSGINEIYRLLTDYFEGTLWTEKHREQLESARIDLQQRRLGLEQARLAVVQTKAAIAEQKRRRRVEEETKREKSKAEQRRKKCTAWCSSAYRKKSSKFRGLTVCEAGKVTGTRVSSRGLTIVSYSGKNYAEYQCQVEYLNCLTMCEMGIQVVPSDVGGGAMGQIGTLRPKAGIQPDNDAGAQSGKKKIRLR